MCRRHREHDYVRSSLLLGSLLLILAGPYAPHAVGAQRKESGPYCGLYCVYGALQSVGKDVAFETLLRPRYLASRQGSSIEELRQAVIDSGAHAVAMTGLGAESLRSARQPMILHIAAADDLSGYHHWALFCGLEDGKAGLLDAPNPMERVPLSVVLARWDGAALIVSDEPSATRSIEMDEGMFKLDVILMILLAVCVIHGGLRLFGSVRSTETPPSVRTLIVHVLGQSVVLLGCSLAIGIALHVVDDTGFTRNPIAVRYVAASNITHFFPKLTLDEARRFAFERRGTIIDARLPDSFRSGSIPGAINVPVSASTVERRQSLEHIPRNTPLLVYCQSESCEFDEILAAHLARDGFESISLYPGGWTEWEKHEHPDRVGQ